MRAARQSSHSLLWTVGVNTYALAVEHISETMRPLPVEARPGMASCMLGYSIIRGAVVQVIDVAALLGVQGRGVATRFITLRAADYRVALSVDAVIGVREIVITMQRNLQPLLTSCGVNLRAAIQLLDIRLIPVFESARFVPESEYASLHVAGGRP